MQIEFLPFDSTIDPYQQQAAELLAAYRAGDAEAIGIIKQRHPQFLDEKIPWRPKNITDETVLEAALDLADARLVIAREYDFRDWAALEEYAAAVAGGDPAVARFEAAVEAVIGGDVGALGGLLREDAELVRARSARVTNSDPPAHRATLLHYVAANGVEGYRQKTPPNAVAVAKMLLAGGAEADALADMYGGQYTTMSMLVSSCHPAEAGVQAALVELLLDYGAAVEGVGSDAWRSPLMTALAFGYREAAEALVRRGARVENIAAAAGLGRIEDVRRMLGAADGVSRHRALALAAQHGQAEVVRLLLDAGEDPNRYNPEGNHSHSTPLHQAVWGEHEAVVRLLVERGAKLDIEDKIYQGTPLGWAIYGKKGEIEKYLLAHGAKR
ncbi:MAG TPA: ankyrin repeat domain-containing protein [Bryobacteraceae bacterium]|nr:ankyrin repeat domain-containing protein [Bryobacteraceae bacterium]